MFKKVIITTFSLFFYCSSSFLTIAFEVEPTYSVVFLGDSGVGKTSLLERLVYDKFEDNKENTLDFYNKKVDVTNFSIRYFDIPFNYRSTCFLPRHVVGKAQIAIIVFDASNSKYNLKELRSFWLNLVNFYNKNAYVFIVANKIDKLENLDNFDFTERRVKIEEIKKFCEKSGYFFLEASAKTGNNIEMLRSQITDELVRREIYSQQETPPDVSLDKPLDLNNYSSCCC